MAAGATSSRSRLIYGPASAWYAAARERRWSAIPKLLPHGSRNIRISASIRLSCRAIRTLKKPIASPSLCFRSSRSNDMAAASNPGSIPVRSAKPLATIFDLRSKQPNHECDRKFLPNSGDEIAERGWVDSLAGYARDRPHLAARLCYGFCAGACASGAERRSAGGLEASAIRRVGSQYVGQLLACRRRVSDRR